VSEKKGAAMTDKEKSIARMSARRIVPARGTIARKGEWKEKRKTISTLLKKEKLSCSAWRPPDKKRGASQGRDLERRGGPGCVILEEYGGSNMKTRQGRWG